MIKLLLYPLTILYGIVVYFRNRLYDFKLLKSVEFDIPIISIGNITVGGTGKTPHTEYLVKLLKEKNAVATLSRGYKRKTKGFRNVEVQSAAIDVGDEPLQIKNKFPDVSVSVCENRVVGVNTVLQQDEDLLPDVILLDDAFQHRRITPGINILLIDYNRPIKEDKLLPVGRLREGIFQMRRAGIIIITKCPKKITPIARRIMEKNVRLKPYQSLYFTTMVYGKLSPVFEGEELTEKFYESKEYSIVAFSGIASPQTVIDQLSEYSNSIIPLVFPDHHNFTKKDITAIFSKFEEIETKNKIIVTTEKDSMRIKDMVGVPEQYKKYIYYLPMEVKFLDQEGKFFNQKINNYVGENKSNSRLYKRNH